MPANELFIDIGASSKEESEQLVRPGTYATFATRYAEFGDGLARGKAFDDRVGCSLLVDLLTVDTPSHVWRVYRARRNWTQRGAQSLRTTCNLIWPSCWKARRAPTFQARTITEQSTIMGQGPAITVMDRTNIPARPIVEQLVRTATDNDVPWQWKRTTFGGTDPGAIHLTREGVPSATVSVPCRYIHSPCVFMSLQDYVNTHRLLEAFLADVPRVAAKLQRTGV